MTAILLTPLNTIAPYSELHSKLSEILWISKKKKVIDPVEVFFASWKLSLFPIIFTFISVKMIYFDKCIYIYKFLTGSVKI